MNEMTEILRELEAAGLTREILAVVGVVLGITLLITAVVSLLLYIFKAAGLHAIARRRGIRHAWLAWIPLADYWVAGSLSDQYRTTVLNKKSWNRIILPALGVLTGVLSLAASGMSLGVLAEMFEYLADGDLQGLVYASTLVGGTGELMSLLYDVLDIALLVFWSIALYDIYSSACPKYKVAFLVLGIIFPVTIPFFLFYNRKKDEGMRIPEVEGEIPPADSTVEYL